MQAQMQQKKVIIVEAELLNSVDIESYGSHILEVSCATLAPVYSWQVGHIA